MTSEHSSETIPAEWLVLIHQLPPGASNPRVRVWRRLQELGAVPLRGAVHVLPNSAQAREDYAWVREEIAGLKGQATLLAADSTTAADRDAIVQAFRSARAADFAELTRSLERVARMLNTKKRTSASKNSAGPQIKAARARLQHLNHIDFFAAPGGDQARALLTKLEEQMANKRPIAPVKAGTALNAKQLHGRGWVTRPRPGVDRMASAWLIRRFVDRQARISFSDHPRASQIPFDMYTGEFSHQGSLCTFEVLASRLGLISPAVVRIGQIVHDLDMKDTRYGVPETAAVGHLVEGLRELYANDRTLLERGIEIFEALARSFEPSAKTPAPRATRRDRR